MVSVPRLILIKDAKGQTITSYFDGKLEPHDVGAAGDKDLARAVLKRLMAMRKIPWIRQNMKNITSFTVHGRKDHEVVSLRNKKRQEVSVEDTGPKEVRREDVHFFRQLSPTGVCGP